MHSFLGDPEGIPCCCSPGCCPNTILPDCITLELVSSCCPAEPISVVLTNTAATTCAGGTLRPSGAADAFCTDTPSVVYAGALPTSWCVGTTLGSGTVLVFCCIDPITLEKSWWIYIGNNTLGYNWYPASTAHYFRLTIISCEPLLLQFGEEPDCNDTCVWTWQAACFVEGTSVRTPNGELPIETLKIGDIVVDIHGTNQIVLNTVMTEVDILLCLVAENGVKTGVTPEHPFMLSDMVSTIEAGNIIPGQLLPLNKMVISKQLFKAASEKFKVFNLSVSGSNTFVADGFAVHNKGVM